MTVTFYGKGDDSITAEQKILNKDAASAKQIKGDNLRCIDALILKEVKSQEGRNTERIQFQNLLIERINILETTSGKLNYGLLINVFLFPVTVIVFHRGPAS